MAKVKIGNVYPTDDYLMARCAPSGYGLGRANARLVDTPDDATNNGFYCVGNDAYDGDETTKDWRLGWAMLLVERRSDTIYQTAKYLDLEWKRNKKNADTAWSPWEWVSPPMEIGVEYRTTERWNGKPVYTTLVDCGSCVSPSKEITTELTCREIIRHCGTVGGHNMPSINATLDNAWSVWAMVTNSDGCVRITVYSGTGMATERAYVQVWYTKG